MMDETGIKEKEDYLEKNNPFCNDEIILNFSLKNCQKDYYYKIKLYNHGKTLGNFTEFETEAMLCDKDNSEINFSKNLVCNYYFYKKQTIIISINKGILIKPSILYMKYDRFTVLSSLMTSPNAIYERELKENDPQSEKFIIKLEKKAEKNRLFDYIKSGILFKSFIAIDFSDETYHILNEQKNQYLSSIKDFRKNLYEFTRLYEVYGFGNNFNNKKGDFFNFCKDENFCELNGYTNIYLSYMEILNEIKFDNENKLKGKSLSPLIKHLVNKIMNQQNPNYYNIIFILINPSNINDYKDCVDVFIQASFLPLSFVIIGIGENDNNFNLIKKLCDENEDNIGKKRIRNNTNFIAIKDFKQNLNKIQDEYLKKIPEQLCEFYFINNVDLNQIKERNINNYRNSLKVFDTYNSLIQQINSEDKIINNDAPPLKEEQNKDKNVIIINNNNIDNNINNVGKIELNVNIKNRNRKNKYKKYVSADNKINKKHIDFNLLKKFGINRTREPKEKINNHIKIESNKSTDITDRKYRSVNNDNKNNFN